MKLRKINLEEYGCYPKLEEVKKDYFELISIAKNITTIAEIEKLPNFIEVEVNGVSLQEFKQKYSDKDIEWIRYESYGSLSYVYIRINNGVADKYIQFDVWSNWLDDDFITDTCIEDLEKEYTSYFEKVKLM